MSEVLHLNLHREFFAAIASKQKRWTELTNKTSPTNTRPRAVQVTAAPGQGCCAPEKEPRDVADNFQNPRHDPIP
jgi:hypothetical protein